MMGILASGNSNDESNDFYINATIISASTFKSVVYRHFLAKVLVSQYVYSLSNNSFTVIDEALNLIKTFAYFEEESMV